MTQPTPHKEPNLYTHLAPFLAVGMGLALGYAWYAYAGTLPARWGDAAAYGAAGVFLFGCSSLYHLAEGTPREDSLNKLDHVGIHVLIAMTGTVHMRILPAIHRDRVGWILLALWGLAALVIVYRLVRDARSKSKLYLVIYGLMAATIVPALDFDRLFDSQAMWLALTGFGVYAVSALVFFKDDRPELHPWWHRGTVVGYLLAGAPVLVV